MSHYTVLVIGEDIEGALAPYDEDLEVTAYIDRTREELEKERKEIIEEAKNPPKDTTIDYSVYKDGMSLAEFVEAYHEMNIDEKGNTLTTYNPESKWDWYAIGGRWKGMLTGKLGLHFDQERFGQLNLDKKEFYTYAVITKDGVWHAPGTMGWFAFSTESEEELEDWKKTYWDRFIKGLSEDTLITVVDCHI